MGRRSRENLGLYRQRTSKRPSDIPFRGPGTPTAGGGDTYSAWTEVSLDPGNAFWVRKNGTNGANQTWSLTNGKMQIDMPNGQDHKMVGNSTKRGACLISAQPINCFPNGRPGGVDAGKWYGEAAVFTVEVQFDTDWPWTAGSSSYGNNNMLALGIAWYNADQGGDPALPGTVDSFAAVVTKNMNHDPSSSTDGRVFKVGFTGQSGITSNVQVRWKNQGGSHADGPNALVFQMGGIPTGHTSGRNAVKGSAYNSDVNDYYPDNSTVNAGLWSTGVTIGTTDNSTKFDGKYCHIYLCSGNWTGNCTTSVVKIKKIRYMVQSLASRIAFPGA